MNAPAFIFVMVALLAAIIYCEVVKRKPCHTFIDKYDGKVVKVYLEGYDSLYVPTYRYEKEGFS